MGNGKENLDGIIKIAGGLLVGGYALFQYTRDDGRTNGRDAKEAPALNQQVIHHHHYYNKDGEPVETKESSSSVVDGNVKSYTNTPKDSNTVAIKPTPVDDDSVSSISSDDEESYRPSWMASSSMLDEEKESFKKPHELSSGNVRAVSDRSVHNATANNVHSQRNLTSTSESVGNVSFSFSDAVFVYPGAGKKYMGSQVIDRKGLNAFGHSVQVEVLETRAGAGEAVLGALSNGSRASVLASSSSLKEMLPSMFEMAQQRLPGVFHVSTFSVDDELAIRQDLSEVMAVRGAGVPVLASGSAQEAHDFAILAHILSQRASAPLIHVLDGSRITHQLTNVKCLNEEELETIAARYASTSSPTALAGLEAASLPDMPHIACLLQQIMSQLSATFGKTYNIFEYHGPSAPEAVVIAMGSVANVAASTLNKGDSSVGVITVRLMQPWSAVHLFEALPASVRRICVIDQSEGVPLFSEVAASLHSSAASQRDGPLPLLVGGRLMPTVRGFSPAMVHAVVSNLMADRPQPGFTLGGLSPTSLQVNFMGGSKLTGKNQIKQIAMFASQKVAKQMDVATKAFASQFASSPNVNVQQFTAIDTYAGDAGVARSEIRMSPSSVPLPESYEVTDAQVVVVEEALLASAGPAGAAALCESGTLIVIRTPLVVALEDEDAHAVDAALSSPGITLPLEVRSLISRKNARVVSVDAQSLSPIVSGDGIQIASLWLALAVSLRECKGDAVYQGLVGTLKNALEEAHPFGEDSAGLNVVASTFGRVEGYTTKLSSSLSFPAPVVRSGAVAAVGNGFDKHDLTEIETNSFSSNGYAAISPVQPSSSSMARFVPRLVVSLPAPRTRVGLCGKTGTEIAKLNHKAALTKIFPDAYSTEAKLRPSEHAVHLVRLTKNQRLTPDEYDRHIFHLEFDISDTDLTYEIGDALGVFGHNDVEEIDHFIAEYGLNPSEIVSIPARGQMIKGSTEVVSVRNLLIQHLDILGKPGKKFYVALASHATSRYEYLKLMHTGTDDNEAYKLGVNEGTTYADLLLQYKTANPTIEQIIEMVPAIKARHYSIASSMKMTPRSVHLLVVAVDWVTPLGRKKYGQCTRYMANLDPSKGDIYVAVDVMPSVLRLPPLPSQPIVMAGLGTGLAPFRAFMQHRKWQKEMGMDVGPCVLYFGARYRREEYLYGDEWDAYEKEGLLKLGLAFSRDQKKKVYIQDKILEDKELLSEHLGANKGYFYLCGPTWPVPAVASAISEALNPEAAAKGEIDFEQVENLKSDGRYILEVY